MRKVALFLFFPLLMSGCSISNTPSGPIFSSFPDASEEKLEFYDGTGDIINEEGEKFTIDFNNLNFNTHSFANDEEILDIINDEKGIVSSVEHNLAYASRNALLLDWSGSIKGYIRFQLNIDIRYVKIFASPFYSKRYDYDQGKDIMVCYESALNLNDKKYVKLSPTQKEDDVSPIISIATFDLNDKQNCFTINTGLAGSLINKIELFV